MSFHKYTSEFPLNTFNNRPQMYQVHLQDQDDEGNDSHLKELEDQVERAYDEVKEVKERINEELDEQINSKRQQEDRIIADRHREALDKIHNEQRQVLERKNLVLEKELNDIITSYTEKINILEDQNDRLLKDLLEKSQENIELKEAMEQFKQIAQENQDARQKYNERAKSLSEGYTLMEAEVALAKEQEQETKQRKKKYKKQVLEYKKQGADLKEEINNILEVNKLQEQERNKLQEEISGLSEIIKVLEDRQAENDKVLEELSEVQSQVIHFKKITDEQSEQLDIKQAQINDASNVIAELNDKIVELDKEFKLKEQQYLFEINQLEESVHKETINTKTQKDRADKYKRKLEKERDSSNQISRLLEVKLLDHKNAYTEIKEIKRQLKSILSRNNDEDNPLELQDVSESEEQIGRESNKAAASKGQQKSKNQNYKSDEKDRSRIMTSESESGQDNRRQRKKINLQNIEDLDCAIELRQLSYQLNQLEKLLQQKEQQGLKHKQQITQLLQDKEIDQQNVEQLKESIKDKDMQIKKHKDTLSLQSNQLKEQLLLKDKELAQLKRQLLDTQFSLQQLQDEDKQAAYANCQRVALRLINYSAYLHSKIAHLRIIKNMTWTLANGYLESSKVVSQLNTKLSERAKQDPKTLKKNKQQQQKNKIQSKLRTALKCVFFISLLQVKKNTKMLLSQGVIAQWLSASAKKEVIQQQSQSQLLQSSQGSQQQQSNNTQQQFKDTFSNADKVLISLNSTQEVLNFKDERVIIASSLQNHLIYLQESYNNASKGDREQIEYFNNKMKEISSQTELLVTSRNDLISQLNESRYTNQSQAITIQQLSGQLADLEFELKLQQRQRQTPIRSPNQSQILQNY